MGFFARLFGGNRRKPEQPPADDAGGVNASTFDPVGAPLNSASDLEAADHSAFEAAVQRAISPVVTELQALRRMIETMERSSAAGEPTFSRQPGIQTPSVAAVDQKTIERAIEAALAHFYQILRSRERLQVPPVFLKPTPDGNTALPLDPQQQFILVVMHPLYPHLYAAQIVLPATFTHVDRLDALPNGVQVYSLHINERKAAPGFIEALRALHRENKENLFLAKLTASQDGQGDHRLEYFRCTGSEIRYADPKNYPGELMIYFNIAPERFAFRQRMNGVEGVFSALEDLMQSEASAASEASPQQPDQLPQQSPDDGGETS